MENETMTALRNAQDAFSGEEKRLGLESEEDVVAMVKDVRQERLDENCHPCSPSE